MENINKDGYKNISIQNLNLSTRTKNALMRAGIRSLYQLIEGFETLRSFRNIGEKSIAELVELLSNLPSEYTVGEEFKKVDEQDKETTEPQSMPIVDISDLSDEIKSRYIEEMRLNTRAYNALVRSGIKTIGQLVELNQKELFNVKNIGVSTANSVIEEILLLRDQKDEYFNKISKTIIDEKMTTHKCRELDIKTISVLHDRYGLKLVVLCDLFGFSRQRLDQQLHRRGNKGQWLNKELLPQEEVLISDMIDAGSVFSASTEPICYISNNNCDDCYILLVYKDDIKCFFLKDLPDVLRKKIIDNGYDRFNEVELNARETLGKTVKVLGETFFVPNDVQFSKLAKSRSMSLFDYSVFLTGYKYCDPGNVVTDDRINNFLHSNTKNGVTRIIRNRDTKWVFEFAEKHGLSIDELIEFYGFNAKSDEESDMQAFEVSSDAGYIEKIYAKYPLLGSKIISAANLDTINRKSRQLINTVMNNSESKLTLQGKMIITLSVINYAKNWAYEDESKFWKYIAEQYGYRDESGRLGNILRESVKEALVDNNRCFLSNSYGNKYKSTVLFHALTPKDTWYRFCGFLYDFYRDNLDCRYTENDDFIRHMISVLKRKLADDDTEEDKSLKIGSSVYSFGDGLVKLIKFRPGYASKVSDTILKHIHALKNNTAEKPCCYEEELCDEWWYDRYLKELLKDPEIKRRDTDSIEQRIARDYSRISPLYCLDNSGGVVISFPSVRLKTSDFASLSLIVMYDGDTVIQKSLSYYGNELGKTLKSFNVRLGDIISGTEGDIISPRFIIKCDDNVIFDSEEHMFRKFIVFNKNTETDIRNCKPGSYSFFTAVKDKLEFINAEAFDVASNGYLEGVYAILKDGFAISFNGELIAFDDQNDEDFRLILPKHKNGIMYVENGERYNILSKDDRIRFVLSGEQPATRFRLFINDKETPFDTFKCDNSENRSVYTIDAVELSKNTTIIKVIDILKDKLIESRKTVVLPKIYCSFNKECYYSSDDYSDSLLTISSEDGYCGECTFDLGDKTVSIPYGQGEIEVEIPVISVTDNYGEIWNGKNRVWKGEVKHDCFLTTELPNGYNAEMLFGNERIYEEKNRMFGLGNAVNGYTVNGGDLSIDISLIITPPDREIVKYLIGKIYVKEAFLNQPKLYVDNGVLSWNKGGRFIGGGTEGITLSVMKETDVLKKYSLDLQSDIIDDKFDLPDGIYKYSINKGSGSLFAPSVSLIAEGEVCVGDINSFRFINSIIAIKALTFESNEKSELIDISKTFIDNIRYVGIEYAEGEERECPVYSGIMYFINPSGEKHEFSFGEIVDDKNRKLYKVNPVRIVYINDNTIEITNEDGDGLYYRKYYDKELQKNKYLITDREYDFQNRGAYSLADLYIYKKEGKENV